MDFRIEEPLMLLIFIPVTLYFIWAFIKVKDKNKLFYIVYSLRVIAVFLLVFALSSPFLLQKEKDEQILFLIDRSASMKANEEEIITFIEESFLAKENHHLVGIYSFANNFQTESLLSTNVKTIPELTSMEDDGETNISQALQIGTSVVDPKKATRIILITDGNETKGKVEEDLYRFQSDRVSIDVVKLDDLYLNDVMVTNFKTPEVSQLGAMQSLEVHIEAMEDERLKLELYENDQKIHEEDVEVAAGNNVFTFEQLASKEGLSTYEVRVVKENDAIIENNHMKSITKIESPAHILIVQNDNGNSNIEKALGNQVLHTTIHAKELPTSLNRYLRYDAIIFDNVPGYLVGEEKMEVIHQAVQNFGLGFMMVGGEMSYGLGGYFKTPIEDLLPVEMEVTGKHKLPTLGLVIVLDRSGSMSGSKMKLAKEAAARSVEMLEEGDTLGVIAFDDRPWTIIETDVMKNQKDAVNKVLSITEGGGTEIYTSLKKAYEDLEPLDLQRKHIILLTDGQENSRKDYRGMIEQGLSNGVTLSTVSIGSDADRKLLEVMSEMASGRFYDVQDENMIPSILSRETAMISKTYIIDEPFFPRVYNHSDWNSIFDEGIPKMNAYIATTLKPGATLLLDHEVEEDPILATWQYGLGKATAFMSDSSGKWTGDFIQWNKWEAFIRNNVKQIMPIYNDTPYTIQQDGRQFTLIDPTHQANLLKITAMNEQGEKLKVNETLASSRELSFTVDGDNGLAFFNIDNGTGTIFNTGKPLPYSDEYRMKEIDMNILNTLVRSTGGKVIEHPDEVFRKMNINSFSTKPINQQLVVVAMLLFFIDITLRRFGLRKILARRKVKEEIKQETIIDRLNK